LLYLGVGSSAAAFALWGYGLARLEAGRVAAVGMLLPLSGVAAAALVLGEPLLPLQLAGGGTHPGRLLVREQGGGRNVTARCTSPAR
jgi:O-acetylserine/cysteine efflux transporter